MESHGLKRTKPEEELCFFNAARMHRSFSVSNQSITRKFIKHHSNSPKQYIATTTHSKAHKSKFTLRLEFQYTIFGVGKPNNTFPKSTSHQTTRLTTMGFFICGMKRNKKWGSSSKEGSGSGCSSIVCDMVPMDIACSTSTTDDSSLVSMLTSDTVPVYPRTTATRYKRRRKRTFR